MPKLSLTVGNAACAAAFAHSQALPRGARIGWLGSLDGHLALESGITEVCEDALRTLESLGHAVEPAGLGFAPERLWQAWITLRSMLAGGALSVHYHDPARRDLLKPEAVTIFDLMKFQNLMLTQDAVRKEVGVRDPDAVVHAGREHLQQPGDAHLPRLLDHHSCRRAPGGLDVLRARAPLGRIGLPIELARAAVFLASDFASYVTGHALVVSGGTLMR